MSNRRMQQHSFPQELTANNTDNQSNLQGLTTGKHQGLKGTQQTTSLSTLTVSILNNTKSNSSPNLRAFTTNAIYALKQGPSNSLYKRLKGLLRQEAQAFHTMRKQCNTKQLSTTSTTNTFYRHRKSTLTNSTKDSPRGPNTQQRNMSLSRQQYTSQ